MSAGGGFFLPKLASWVSYRIEFFFGGAQTFLQGERKAPHRRSCIVQIFLEHLSGLVDVLFLSLFHFVLREKNVKPLSFVW